jgi:hypothetical protein
VSNWRYLCPIIFAALFSASQVHSQSVKEPNKGNNEFLITIDKMLLLEALPGELLHILRARVTGLNL